MSEVKKLVLRGLAFLLPLALIWSVVVFGSDETMGLDAVIHRQLSDQDTIYGPAYSMNNPYYRSAFARAVKPELLVIGDSRISQIRNSFFLRGEKVYNACWGAISPAEVQGFLESQEGGHIKTVLFSISHFDFNVNYLEMEAPAPEIFTSPTYGRALNYWQASASILEDWKAGRLALPRLAAAKRQRLGVSAINHNAGVLCDGSFYSDNADKTNFEFMLQTGAQFDTTLRHIEAGAERFQYGDAPNPVALGYMEKLLDYCRENGIELVGFLPPYAPTVNAAMEHHRVDYGYHFALADALTGMFREKGFEFYDHTDVTPLGCDDSFFVDGYHAGEPAMLRVLASMAEEGEALAGWCNVEALRALDEGRMANYQLFGSLEEYQSRMARYEVA